MAAVRRRLTCLCCPEPRSKNVLLRVYPFLSDYDSVWEMDQAKDAYNELQEYSAIRIPCTSSKGKSLRSWATSIFNSWPRGIQAEILWGIGLMDTGMPPSTQFAAIQQDRFTQGMAVYPDFAHEPLPGFNDQAFQFMKGL